MDFSTNAENRKERFSTPFESQAVAVLRTTKLEQIYATDLVYIPDCWKLCGDAHCCNFARYKKQFRLIGRSFELHLLPGEYEFLAAKGWLSQFEPFEHKVIELPIEDVVLKIESIISRKPNCICDHDTRTIMCRLYPRLPVFDTAGHLLGTESMGIFEEMEQIERLTPACQVTSVPFEQLEKFLAITAILASSPTWLYYLEAYRLTKLHITRRLAAQRSASDRPIFHVFESAFLRNMLIDREETHAELSALADRFRDFYGDSSQLA